MNVLLTGANGFVGRNIAAMLTTAGHHIKPVSRQYGCDFARMQSAEDWLPHLQEIDAVINSVGIIGESADQRFDALHTHAPIALFQSCQQVGIKRVIQISALGADESAFSAYHLSKRAADDFLRTLDLDWFVLRPAPIYGRGGTSAQFFMRLAGLPLVPMIGNGKQELQPIHISDMAATVLRALTAPTTRQTLDIAGTETITFGEWLQLMRQAQGLAGTPFIHFPLALVETLMRIGSRFSPLLRVDNLRMLQASHHADTQPFTDFLGRAPLKLESRLFFSDMMNAGNPQ
jgi:uncharacterized protein YbjT (DUF2867 family)